MGYLTTLLNNAHEKQNFACGKPLLDRYLHTQAKQDVKRKLTACFVIVDQQNCVSGYYTLSNTSIKRDLLPSEIKIKLPPSYTDLPATLLGRLAVDHQSKGKGIGGLLLLDALKRSYDTAVTSVASMAVIVDPIDPEAVGFYQKYGFIALPDSGKLFLPMATVAQLFQPK